MKRLLFIHFTHLEGFEPFSINFSNDFNIQLQGNILSIEKKTNVIRELLGENISDVNVIAGENGVGKTTLLKQIAEILSGNSDYPTAGLYDHVSVFLTEESTFNILFGFEEANTYTVKLGEDLEGYQVVDVSSQSVPIIYYSPFLDFNLLDISTRKQETPIFDISLTQQIITDTNDNNGTDEIDNSIYSHKLKNIKRQIDFINDTKGKFELPFELPDGLFVKFNRLTLDRDDLSVESRDVFEKLESYCALHFREYPESTVNLQTIAKLMFLRNLLTVYFRGITNEKTQSALLFSHGALYKQILEFSNKDSSKLIKLIQKFFIEDTFYNSSFFTMGIDFFFKLISDKDVKIDLERGNNVLSLKLGSKREEIAVITNILKATEFKTKKDKLIYQTLPFFVTFDWRNFSSGEKTFLDIFSRFYYVRDLLSPKQKNIAILIDEAEVAFHPIWQIKYVSFLSQFFETHYADFQVQILIATHSPLVLSDFPSERVHLLKKEQLTKRSYKVPTFGTFAQNISVLLAKDFFVDNTLIGQLAKKYIDSILDKIESVDSSNLNELIDQIELIDEPIIKRLLKNKLIERRLDA